MVDGHTIKAPINSKDPYCVLGIGTFNGSWDVGYPIIKSKSGGNNIPSLGINSAFNIKECGGQGYNGELINGAEPYWNIWSNESPGYWDVQEGIDSPLIFKLKRFFNTNLYNFDLSYWNKYNHNAAPPRPSNQELILEIGSSTTQTIGISVSLGDYDFKKVNQNSSNAVVAELWDGSSLIAKSDIRNIESNTLILFTADIIINTSSPYEKVFEVKISVGHTFGSQDFDMFGYVPLYGTYTVKVVKPLPAASVAVVVSRNIKVFSVGEIYTDSGGSYSFNALYNDRAGIETDGKMLTRILYEAVDRNGVVLEAKEVTQISSYEGPRCLGRYSAYEPTETFYIQKDRLMVNKTTLRAIMYYE